VALFALRVLRAPADLAAAAERGAEEEGAAAEVEAEGEGEQGGGGDDGGRGEGEGCDGGAEERAFWLVAALAQHVLPHYYVPSMTGTRIDMALLSWLVARHAPAVAAHMEALECPLELVVSQWLLPLFVTTVRARPGRLSALRVFLCKSVFYGAFVWARRALNSPKRRVPARAVPGALSRRARPRSDQPPCPLPARRGRARGF
jgi:hypothetical protein